MTAPTRAFLAPMRGRASDEPHRVSTPLELFFDLCFVVAVSQAAEPLHHAIVENHAAQGVRSYLMVFFAIWWAWNNFTWFASAYDTDDVVYRVTTLLQIAGALVLAAGVSAAFEGDWLIVTIGYVVMRLALVVQWLRAARGDRQRRPSAVRYAVGVTVVQALWLLRLLLPDNPALIYPAFAILVLLELSVPVIAENAPGGPTKWHPHHIAERYGLFTLIVLGESVASATVAFRGALDESGGHAGALLRLAVSGLVIVFALWWLYFDRPVPDRPAPLHSSLAWGYGHYFIFASAAAFGAGLGVNVDFLLDHAEISQTQAEYAIALPVAVYLSATWLLHVRSYQSGVRVAAIPVAVVLVLLTPLLPASVMVLAGLMVVLVVVTIRPKREW
jgi:low temperature requirement protein LtrA